MTSNILVKGEGRIVEGLSLDLVLSAEHVTLLPMQMEHIEGLIEAASVGKLWELPFTTVPNPDQMLGAVKAAIVNRDNGSEFPFVVVNASTGRILGSTRYYRVEPVHRNLSIGYTWYSQDVQRSAVNSECKYLLLEHAFERMNCISVQWHTDHRNKRSQAAIKRLGAKFEGVLRNDKIMPNGVIRHTYCYSMLSNEWAASKAFLQSSLDAHQP